MDVVGLPDIRHIADEVDSNREETINRM